MKKLLSSNLLKIVMALLLLVSVTLGWLGIVVVSYCYRYSYKVESYRLLELEEAVEQELSPWCERRLYNIMENYRHQTPLEDLDDIPGMSFVVWDDENKLVYDGLEGKGEILLETEFYGFWYPAEGVTLNDGSTYYIENYGTGAEYSVEAPLTAVESTPAPYATALPTPVATGTPQVSATPEATPAPEATAAPETAEEASPKRYKIKGYILEDMPKGSYPYQVREGLSFAFDYQGYAMRAIPLAVIAALLSFAWLVAGAGHRKNQDELVAGLGARLPFDVFCLGAICVFCVQAMLVSGLSYSFMNQPRHIGVALIMGSIGLLAVWCCMVLKLHIKRKTLISSCLCWRVLAWCWRKCRALWRFCVDCFRGLRLMPRAALVIGGVLLVEFFGLVVLGGGAELAFAWFIERLVLVALTVYVLLCMLKLLKAGQELAGGNIDYTVDDSRMYGPLKEHAKQLNSIGQGLNKAVGERMKSERLRTELITNVSHDIKTPLTSIINYVDLLEKEEIENEKAREYLDVLSRQSARLKKLIDDLMDASKASTGNVSVNLQPCELGVLLDQSAGEYAEKLRAARLELIINKPREPVTIMADGRHIWRIFDNLLNNICKYAMAGTRVYLSLERAENRALVTFRNISASVLNVKGDELLERFVRGDASRNTEGSGLGLSIARSLAQLQGGELDIVVDGDLFKINLSFPIK